MIDFDLLAFCIFRDRLQHLFGDLDYKKYWEEDISKNVHEHYLKCAKQYIAEFNNQEKFRMIPASI